MEVNLEEEELEANGKLKNNQYNKNMHDLTPTFHFLIDLKFNNNRNWFHDHKETYENAKLNYENVVNEVLEKLKKIDPSIDVTSGKDCMYRIYRDARFTKGKEPYKNNFGALIAKGGRKSIFAGYYMHFEPDNSFIGGGLYKPEATVLKSIRTKIMEQPKTYKAIINDPTFKKYFSEIKGDKLKMAPKGFSKDFEDIDLLKNKDFIASTKIDNEFWLDKNVANNIVEIFKILYKFNAFFNNCISEIK